VFDDYDKAAVYIKSSSMPVVVKADGLALGKGVIICETTDEALDALKEIMVDKVFGDAGSRVVIEEFLEGPEVSVLAFCDGKTILPMQSAQDHKRAYDGDQGPNTGGMGTFSPSPKYSDEIRKIAEETVIRRTVEALNAEGVCFKGIIFFGFMLTKDGPKLLEYNARFGDPEAQVVLPRLKNDLLEIMGAVIDGTLDKITLEWDERSAVCVVIASGGYPSQYAKGVPIFGMEKVKDAVVYHAGTALKDGEIVTNGGRVLGITALGANIPEARKKAYGEIEKVNFEGAQYRTDIGIK
jgi:phosphoribosylamine--glycine ligase